MSSDIFEKIGRGLYSIFRKAAKIPLDINQHLLGGDRPVVQKGSIYDHVEEKMGERRYKRLCQDTALALDTIFYCQEELGSLGKSLQATRKLLNSHFDETELKKRLINHDFLVLKVKPGKQNEPTFHIKAEKVAGGDDANDNPGIHLFFLEGLYDQDLERRCCLYKIECGGAHIGLGDVMAVLKKKSADYDARDENCWDYARITTKWLLEACRKALASEECGEYWRLHWELEHLEINLVKKHAVNNVGRAVKYVKSHVWDKLTS